MHLFLTCMLRVRISPGCLCSASLKEPLRSVHKLVPRVFAQCTHQFLTHMLSAGISSWCICSAYASVSDAHAQFMHQFLLHMLRVYKMNIWKMVTDAHAEHAHKELMHMVRACISSWPVCSVCRSMPVRNSIFSIISKVLKIAKQIKNCWWH
jgi:hypothetical protein